MGAMGQAAEAKSGAAKKPKYALQVHKERHEHAGEYTQRVVKQVAKIFKKFDKDRNGTISPDEFRSALKEIEGRSDESADRKMSRIFRDVHLHGYRHLDESRGSINFDEFLQAVYVAGAGDESQNELLTVVKEAATSGKKKKGSAKAVEKKGHAVVVSSPSSGEQKKAFHRPGEKKTTQKSRYALRIERDHHKYASEYTKSAVYEAMKIFKTFDVNRDGTISRSEFRKALLKIEAAATESAADIKTGELFREIHMQGYKEMDNSQDNINFDEFLQAVFKANNTEKNVALKELKMVYDKAKWHIEMLKNVHRFYAPHKDVHEYTQDYNCCPPPFLMIGVSILMLISFIWYATKDNRCGEQKLGSLDLECPEVYTSVWAYHYNSACKGEPWRFVTYMFLHVGAAHITSNLTLQILVGVPLEMVHGWWRVALIYFLGGIAGTCCVSMFDEKTNVIGASGGVYALLGAHVANIINYWQQMPYAVFRTAIFGTIFAVDIVSSAYAKYVEGDKSVSYSSHMGGALCGWALGMYVLDEFEWGRERDWFEWFREHFGLYSTIICFFSALIYNIATPQC